MKSFFSKTIKPSLLAALLTLALPAMAEDVGAAQAQYIIIIGLLSVMIVVTVLFLVLTTSLYFLLVDKLSNEDKKATAGQVQPKETGFARFFWEKLNGAVAIEKERDVLLDHNYDGIQELDNSLPPWWKMGFYITILGSFVYIWWYHFGEGSGTPVSVREYRAELSLADDMKKAALAAAPETAVDESNVTVLSEEEALTKGKGTYLNFCAACHGQAGEGGVGPNLTDEYWLHGGDIAAVFKTVKYGVPDKGMLAWQQQLKPVQMQQVSSYILSLQGTNPANGKAPQGEKYVPATQP